jgi:L-fucose mutarotase
MLKGLPAFMDADLLWILAAMGHGDELTVVDRNFPAQSLSYGTRSGKVVTLSGMNTREAIAGIVSLVPLDNFVETALWRMDPVDRPGSVLPVHQDVIQACSAAEGREVRCGVLDRASFYAAAERSFAIVHTSEDRPYGCFILKKGVVFEP